MQHEKVWAPKCCKHNGKWRFQLRNVANNCKYGWNGSFQLQNAANSKKNGQKSRSKKTSQNGQTNNSQNNSGPIKILVGDFGFLKIGVFAQGQLNCWPQLEWDMTLRWEPLQRTKSTERKKTWPKRTGMKSMQKAPAPATCIGGISLVCNVGSFTFCLGGMAFHIWEHDEHTNVVLQCFALQSPWYRSCSIPCSLILFWFLLLLYCKRCKIL